MQGIYLSGFSEPQLMNPQSEDEYEEFPRCIVAGSYLPFHGFSPLYRRSLNIIKRKIYVVLFLVLVVNLRARKYVYWVRKPKNWMKDWVADSLSAGR
jgi:hypothetical protein